MLLNFIIFNLNKYFKYFVLKKINYNLYIRMPNMLIQSEFYKLDGSLSDKLDYYLDNLEILRLVYINQYVNFVTKKSYSTRIRISLGYCEKQIMNSITKINNLLKRASQEELEEAFVKVKLFEKIVTQIQIDIPSFNDKKLIIFMEENRKQQSTNILKEPLIRNSFRRNSYEEKKLLEIMIVIDEEKNKKRLKELQKLNEDMIMLKEMFIDLQQITAEQEPLIDDLLDNIDETNNNTEQAVVELREAQNYQVNMFGYKLAVLGSLVGALIGGPIGFVVLGTKIATGIGATTCGVVGLIGGNRVSKNYREPDI